MERVFANPYPERPVTPGPVSLIAPLSLIRPPARLLDRLGEDGDYIVQHDYDVGVVLDGVERVVTVPRGLITDLTSVPWLLRWYVGRVGPWLEAAILHDWLYVAWQVVGVTPDAGMRLFADRLMLRAMEAAQVGALRRWLIYLSVRAFGGSAFFRRTPRTEIFADLEARLYATPLVLPD